MLPPKGHLSPKLSMSYFLGFFYFFSPMAIATKYLSGCDMILKSKSQISAVIFFFKKLCRRTKRNLYLKSENFLRVHICSLHANSFPLEFPLIQQFHASFHLTTNSGKYFESFGEVSFFSSPLKLFVF